MIKSKRMIKAGYVISMVGIEMLTKLFLEDLKGRYILGDGGIILK
jgi:hypothetical protein